MMRTSGLAALACAIMAAPAAATTGEALAAFEAAIAASHSDRVIVWQDGEVLVDMRSASLSESRPVEMMSATKGIVALAAIKAVSDGLLPSLETPVADYFPEWRQGRKARITLRMLLDHRSGLQNVALTSVEIYPSSDFVQLALAAELVADPDSVHAYNNKAMNLAAAVIERAVGKPIDAYLGEALFAPMGISEFAWATDPAGNKQGMAGAQLRAEDALKIGRLVLNRGMWNGVQLIRPELVELMLRDPAAGQHGIAMSWYRTPAYLRFLFDEASLARIRAAGLPEKIFVRVATLVGRDFADRAALRDALIEALGEDGLAIWRDTMIAAGQTPLTLITNESGPTVAYSAQGYLGQYIVIVPSKRAVAVRQYVSRNNPPRNDSHLDFIEDLLVLLE